MNGVTLWPRLLAELLGSSFLTAAVIGSGIAAQRLSPGDTRLQWLENAAAIPGFIAAQVIGGALAVAVIRVLYPGVTSAEAADVIVPHPGDHAASS